jgi:hypothetical protein
MKYETPELTALAPAINAIQGVVSKILNSNTDAFYEGVAAYVDWED